MKNKKDSMSWRFASGASILTLSNVFNRLLALAVMPFLTHLISPNAFGVAALITTIISLMSVFALAGADVSYIRASQDPSYEPREVERVVWSFVLVTGAITSASGALFWLISSHTLNLPTRDAIYLVLGVLSSLGSTMALARARLKQRHAAIALAIALSGCAGVGSSLIAVSRGITDETPLLLNLLTANIVLIVALRTPSLTLTFSNFPPINTYISIIRIGLSIIYTATAYWIMSSSDRWLLQYFYGATDVGIYAVASSIGLSGLALNSALITIWGHQATKLIQDGDEKALCALSTSITITHAISWLAVSSAGGDALLLLTSPQFHPGAVIIPITAGGVFFHGMIHLANGIYISDKRISESVVWWLAGMLTMLTIGFFLIPKTGIRGAAIAQFGGLGIVALGMFSRRGSARLLRHFLRWRPLLSILLVAVLSPVMIAPWSANPLMSLAMKLPVGLIVTAIAWVLTRSHLRSHDPHSTS